MNTKTQWRTSGFGIVGLDYQAVFIVADTLEIEVNRVVLKKLQALEYFELNRIADDQDKDNISGDQANKEAFQTGSIG
jgi:hypothetical protein